MNPAPVRVLLGPTASGKTAVGIELARRHDGEIVSVDSRQLYRGLAIGSAAPTPGERGAVPHHFVEEFEPADVMTAGAYGERARAVIEAVRARGHAPILVGGSGMYLHAALGGFDDDLPSDEAVRARLMERVAEEGSEALHRELHEHDPGSAARIQPRDVPRITRALELIALTGEPASALRKRGRAARVPARIAVLHREKPDLERRIRARVDAMIEAGLEAEVRALREAGVSPDLPALRSVGYTETLAYLDGKLEREAWREAIVVNTRRYAKRQRTWFRGTPGAVWVPVAEHATVPAIADAVEHAWDTAADPGDGP